MTEDSGDDEGARPSASQLAVLVAQAVDCAPPSSVSPDRETVSAGSG